MKYIKSHPYFFTCYLSWFFLHFLFLTYNTYSTRAFSIFMLAPLLGLFMYDLLKQEINNKGSYKNEDIAVTLYAYVRNAVEATINDKEFIETLNSKKINSMRISIELSIIYMYLIIDILQSKIDYSILDQMHQEHLHYLRNQYSYDIEKIKKEYQHVQERYEEYENSKQEETNMNWLYPLSKKILQNLRNNKEVWDMESTMYITNLIVFHMQNISEISKKV